MPLWAESRIHGDVYVRFGGRLSETYRRKVARRRLPSLQITNQKVNEDMKKLFNKVNGKYQVIESDITAEMAHKKFPHWKKINQIFPEKNKIQFYRILFLIWLSYFFQS